MSKTLAATCSGSAVKVDGVAVPSAVILSEGVGESTGVVLLDEDKAFYLAKISPDLKTAIERTIEGLEAAKTALTETATVLPIIAAPGTTAAATAAAAQITSAVGSMTSAISALNTLKGALK